MNSPLSATLLTRLRRRGRGAVFTPKDFSHLGNRAAVDQTLSRLTKAGVVQRLGRGLYFYPRVNPRLGIAVPPQVDEIAAALARQTGSRIAPSGAVAANRLGLSTQVPGKLVYLSDGKSKQVRVGNYTLVIKHVAPKELPVGSPATIAVLQALRHLGRDAVDDRVLQHIRGVLSPRDRSQLVRDARYTTDWLADAVRRISASEPQANDHG